MSVGERDIDWPAFVFVTNERGSGWIPARHLSAEAGIARVLEPYDTTELRTTAGELLEILKYDHDSGWHWCRAASGQCGWVPARTMKPAR